MADYGTLGMVHDVYMKTEHGRGSSIAAVHALSLHVKIKLSAQWVCMSSVQITLMALYTPKQVVATPFQSSVICK